MSEDTSKNLPNEDSKASTTKPMLEAILAKVNELAIRVDEGFKGVDKKFDAINARLDEADKKFDGVNTKLDALGLDIRDIRRNVTVLYKELLNLQSSHDALEERMDNFERKAS